MKDTKTRIMDAAEKLFSKRGVQGASLRMITRKAGVNLAAINYHFGSKENLVGAVLKRVIGRLAKKRDRILEEAKARAGDSPLSVEVVVHAFMEPWFLFRQESPEYVRVIVRTYTSRNRPTGLFDRVVYDASRDAYSAFSEELCKALPTVPPDVLRKRINFAVLATASFLFNAWLIEGLEELSDLTIDEEMIFAHVVSLIECGSAAEKK